MKPESDDNLCDRLADDCLPGDFSEDALTVMLTHAGRRRRRRTLVRTAVFSLPVVLLLVGLLTSRPSRESTVPRTADTTVPARPPIKQVSDEELIDLLPGRTVMIVTVGGKKQVFVSKSRRETPSD